MSYFTGHNEKDNFVFIKGYGELSTEEYQNGSMEIVSLLSKHRSQRLLVDNSLIDNQASIAELYQLPDFFKCIGLPKSTKVAYFIDMAVPSAEEFKFFETVCRNKGYYINLFQTFVQAVNWLIEDKL
ncbi:MAG: hypothetical protein MJE63_17985 [Proteobacteria bacterium]|nr:hypothetical protein [Pseudomonadota bacterium]